jgi:hypothetical protein
MGLLKTEDGRAVTVEEGLQVREPSSDSIHIPLEKIRNEWEDGAVLRRVYK